MPVAVEQLELGLVLVGRVAEIRQFAAGEGAIGQQVGLTPAATLAGDRLAQGEIAGIEVEAAQRRGLVVDGVSEEAVGDGHGARRAESRYPMVAFVRLRSTFANFRSREECSFYRTT